jgi:hypothetical protein
MYTFAESEQFLGIRVRVCIFLFASTHAAKVAHSPDWYGCARIWISAFTSDANRQRS